MPRAAPRSAAASRTKSGAIRAPSPLGPSNGPSALTKPRASFLDPTDTFVRRHVGPDDQEVRAMLGVIGADSLAQLVDETVPAGIRLGRELALGDGFRDGRGEAETLAELHGIASKNAGMRSFIGCGYASTITRRSSSGTSSRTPRGTRSTRPTRRRSARAPGGAAELPDGRVGSHGAASRRRVAARRVDGRRRGDGDADRAARPAKKRSSSRARTATRRPSRSCRPAPRRSASRWSSVITAPPTSRRRVRRLARQYPNTYGRESDFRAFDRAGEARRARCRS